MSRESLLDERNRLTNALLVSPEDLDLLLHRAGCYERLGLPELALGDAYRALLLTDDAEGSLDEEGDDLEDEGGNETESRGNDGETQTRSSSKSTLQSHIQQAYTVLIRNLKAVGCMRTAWEFAQQARRHPAGISIDCTKPVEDEYVDKGQVTPWLYPWNTHEPHRYDPDVLDELNDRLRAVAPKCRVQVVDLPLLYGSDVDEDKVQRSTAHDETSDPGQTQNQNSQSELVQDEAPTTLQTQTPARRTGEGPRHRPTVRQLGLFACEDVAPGEEILCESSLLTANNRLHDSLCDCCSAALPASATMAQGAITFACPECDDTVFCSQTCQEAALQSYHPAICGYDVDAIARDTESAEAADALYFQLLARVIAMAQTQQCHPLDLFETRFLWGDLQDMTLLMRTESSHKESSKSKTMPFSFNYNVLYPLHLLEKMGVDAGTCIERFDFWILNTLMAKFRGVASGRQNPRTGQPEVCAVHPLWCLANHSCSPNVRWDWAADIRFWARTKEELVQWGPSTDPHSAENSHSPRKAGIAAGNEILNHYCDLRLDVQSRREWARGALGGICMCERCVWEASKLEKVHKRS